MRRLVVLVGLPGSGKTAFQKRHPEWAAVSKDAIRREIFHCNFTPRYEDVVDRIFASVLVEVIGSDVEVVCVDDLNLSRSVRSQLVELALLSGREAIAYVMPSVDPDELYSRVQLSLAQLSASDPNISVADFDRHRFDMLVRSYDPVDMREGFARVESAEMPPDTTLAATRREVKGKPLRKKRIEKREPLPLFVP